MVLDDEKQRKTLLTLVSNVRVQGSIPEAEATIAEIRKLLGAIKGAKVEKDGNKKGN